MISLDHRGFYRCGTPFFPKIQSTAFPLKEWSDAVLLKLPASLQDDLDWSLEKKTAEKILEKGKGVLWEIDFQFDARKLILSESSAFFAHVRALEEFVRFSSGFSDSAFGVCLYRGGVDFASLFDQAMWAEPFDEWLDELAQSSYPGHELRMLPSRDREWLDTSAGLHYLRLFSADLFASYLHRLVSFLPDGLLPFVFFDVGSAASPSIAAQLFSKERFKYLHLGLKRAEFPFSGLTLEQGAACMGWVGDREMSVPLAQDLATTAICLPNDAYCDRRILGQLDDLMRTLNRKGSSFRIICEEALTEEWDGLDRLIVLPETVSAQCKRKLQGFIAAGGEVIHNCN